VGQTSRRAPSTSGSASTGRSSTILEVPVQFRYDDMGGALRSILDTGTFNYRVTGDVRLAEPIGRTFPYRQDGHGVVAGRRE
jgi:hypothetical protein